MSQRVIGYEGDGRLRRPVYADEGAASVRVDGVAALGVLSASQVRGSLAVGGGAGPVERREISAAEIDARRLAAERPSPIAPRPVALEPKEEPAVVEAAQDVTTDIPRTIPEPNIVALSEVRGDGPGWSELGILADAVLELIEADTERVVAQRRWLEARTALDAAYRALEAPSVVELATIASDGSAPTPIGGGSGAFA